MVLLIHQAALGDFIVTWPLIRAWADRAVTLVAPSSQSQLAAASFEHVSALDINSLEWSSLFSSQKNPHRPRGAGGAFDQVVTFVSGEPDLFTNNLRKLWPAANVICVAPPPEDWASHVHVWHLRELSRQGAAVGSAMPALRVNAGGHVVIHPGAGGAAKRWPMERFAQLSDALTARRESVRWVIGEVELEKLTATERAMLPADCVRGPRLDELAHLLRSASLFIGNDSGPAHLAAQLGTRTAAIFGPTSPARWSPLGPRVSVIAPPSPRAIDWVDVETVLQAVIELRAQS